MTFAQPLWLLALPLLPWLIVRQRQTAPLAFRLPQPDGLPAPASWRTRLRAGMPYVRWIVLALVIIAMARPQRRWQDEKIKANALDIMLALDISPSMLSKDFDPDRLAVAKKVAINFVNNRPYDRIGLAAFSAEAFTQCPPTTDKRVLEQFIRELEVGRLADGTAVGRGLATAINRLKDSPSASKIIILLTDGEDNVPDQELRPMEAADIAKKLGMRVYTVGIGTEGFVESPAIRNPDGTYEFAPRFTHFDTELLENIAAATNGRFYRAYSEKDLEGIYAEIDRLEKTEIEVTTVQQTTEIFTWFVGLALLLLVLEFVLRWGVLRSVTT